MAIEPLSKVTLFGPAKAKEAVLHALQELGCAHLVGLDPKPVEEATGAGLSDTTRRALRYLRTSPVQRRASGDREAFHDAEVTRRALELMRLQEELENERDELRRRVRELEPWGDFVVPDAGDLGGLRLWFYRLPHRRVDDLRDAGFAWQLVGSDSQHAYLAAAAASPPPELPEAPLDLDPRGLNALLARLDEVGEELEEVAWRRAELTRWSILLERDLDAADDEVARRLAAAATLDADRVFALQGWVAHADLSRVEELVARHRLAMTIAPPDPLEIPPTKLDNAGIVRGGEAALRFYVTPGYRSWDPSAVVTFSFAIFFGMIVSDAGYGLLMAMILVFAWRRLGTSEGGRRLRFLGGASAVASVVWGACVGSYFGLRPTAGSALDWLHLPGLDPTDQSTMMSLCIIIGAAHLVLANLVTAWRYGRSPRALAPVGWAAVILGGLIAGFEWQSSFDPEGRWIPLDIVILIAGFGSILLFSSPRPWSAAPAALLRRLLDGVKAVTGLSQAFGDVLSYLRIFALGLASAQLAITFNSLARSASDTPGFGVLLAALIVVLGHGLNFVLAVMSGVVHGLRLIFIEFFNWSLKEEGHPFLPFAKKART
jgi:V/A-type H+-transporting ATPase subunit I